MKGTDMNGIRRFLGVMLILFASAAMGAATFLWWLGRAVMPSTGANGPQRGSGGRAEVLYPRTVRLDNGRHVTMYTLRKEL